MKERIVIIFIVLVFGLLVTTIVFYVYQTTKRPPQKGNENQKILDIKTDNKLQDDIQNKIPLSIDEPKDESITQSRTIQVKGKTNPENTVVISSNVDDTVLTPDANGNFSASITIDTQVNRIVTLSISPNGDEVKDERTVTYSQEEF